MYIYDRCHGMSRHVTACHGMSRYVTAFLCRNICASKARFWYNSEAPEEYKYETQLLFCHFRMVLDFQVSRRSPAVLYICLF